MMVRAVRMAWEEMTVEEGSVVVRRYTWLMMMNTDGIGGSVGSGGIFGDWTVRWYFDCASRSPNYRTLEEYKYT